MRLSRGRWSLGRMMLLRLSPRVVVVLGPHWYTTIIMSCMIAGLGLGYAEYVTPLLRFSIFNRGVMYLLTACTLGVFCYLAYFSDPGLLTSTSDRAPVPKGGFCRSECCPEISAINYPSDGSTFCHTCGVIQPLGCLHCEFCDVCVTVHDHHCVWTSKCIGGANYRLFIGFMCLAFGSLTYMALAFFLLMS